MATITDPDPWAISDNDEAQALPSHNEASPPQPCRDRQPEHDSAPDIDELAVVQVAHDGLRLRLRGADRDEAVRRMHGRVELDLIAWRLYTTTRTVHRVAARLGLTEHNTDARRDLLTRRRRPPTMPKTPAGAPAGLHGLAGAPLFLPAGKAAAARPARPPHRPPHGGRPVRSPSPLLPSAGIAV